MGEYCTPNSEAEARQIVNHLDPNIRALRLEQVSLDVLTDLADALRSNRSLLKLSTYEVCDKAASALAKALRVNRSLQLLCVITPNDMRYKQMSPKGVIKLCKALEANDSLLQLQICGNLMELPSCEAISQLLAKNKTLQALELSGCHLGDRGLAPLAAILELNQCSIKKLIIRRGSFSAAGGSSLVRALLSNTTLQKLLIADHYVADATLEAFGTLLESNTPLISLKIYSMYDCSPAGLNPLIDGLAKNSSLRVLSLAGTTFTPSEQPWARGMALNQTLVKLDLEECAISMKDATDLLWSLRDNTSLRTLKLSSYGVMLDDESSLSAISCLIEAHPALKCLSVGLTEEHLQNLRALASTRAIELNPE